MYTWAVSVKVEERLLWFYRLRHSLGPTSRKMNFDISVSLVIHRNPKLVVFMRLISVQPRNERKFPNADQSQEWKFPLSFSYYSLNANNTADESTVRNTMSVHSVSQIWNWSIKYRWGCIIFVWNPGLGRFYKGNLKSFISGPRSACGLTALLFCSVVLMLHVLSWIWCDLWPAPYPPSMYSTNKKINKTNKRCALLKNKKWILLFIAIEIKQIIMFFIV